MRTVNLDQAKPLARARDFFALGKGDKTPVVHNNFQWQAQSPNPFKVCKKKILQMTRGVQPVFKSYQPLDAAYPSFCCS